MLLKLTEMNTNLKEKEKVIYNQIDILTKQSDETIKKLEENLIKFNDLFLESANSSWTSKLNHIEDIPISNTKQKVTEYINNGPIDMDKA